MVDFKQEISSITAQSVQLYDNHFFLPGYRETIVPEVL